MNTIILGLDGIIDTKTNTWSLFNIIFTIIFSFEIIN